MYTKYQVHVYKNTIYNVHVYKIPRTCIQKYQVHVYKNTMYMYTKIPSTCIQKISSTCIPSICTCIQNTKYMHTKYQVHVYKISSTCIQRYQVLVHVYKNTRYMYTKIPSTCIQKIPLVFNTDSENIYFRMHVLLRNEHILSILF